jgi:short-subunit dehydrogenase
MISSQHGIAVVTGAAGGLGACFATKLAERGHHLLLVDRRREQLELICETISERYGVSAQAYVADLSKRDQVHRLAERLQQPPHVELLVNNAGFGAIDYFADTDIDYLLGMADLHVVAPTILIRAVLPGMMERDRGGIINVASVGAFLHNAGNAQYGATKSYLASLSLTLRDELRGTNVCVQALCPGFVRTGFHSVESMKAFNVRCNPAESLWLTPDQVVECSLANLSPKKVLVFPTFKYRLFGRLAQFPILRPLMQRFTRLPRTAPVLAAAKTHPNDERLTVDAAVEVARQRS